MPPRAPAKPGLRHRKRPDPLAKAVGQRIKKLRLKQDFTFDAWVEELGLGRGYISELERGLVVPSLTVLAKVASALEMTVADVVLGATKRELIFEHLRDAPANELDRLLAQLRQARR